MRIIKSLLTLMLIFGISFSLVTAAAAMARAPRRAIAVPVTAVSINVTAGPALDVYNLSTMELIVPEDSPDKALLKVGDLIFFEIINQEEFNCGEGIITGLYQSESIANLAEPLILILARH